jgi:ferredoxin
VIYIGRNRKATVNEDLCNGCAKCVRICPEKAIEMIIAQNMTDKTAISAEIQSSDAITNTILPKKKENPEERIIRKKTEHGERVVRTFIACVLGVIAGITSYFTAGAPDLETGIQTDPFIGIMILLVTVVLQRTIFILVKIDITKLGKKDWFYQTFMTFATWYLSWTIILSTSLLTE